jgi:hypothetical protein
MKEINNNIQETNCSLEISKLLKEKGFNVPCSAAYIKEFVRNGKTGGDIFTGNIKLVKNPSYFLKPRFVCYAPTHSIALEWIRVNFGVHIIVEAQFDENETEKGYFFMCYKNNKDKIQYQLEYISGKLIPEIYSTPQEAIDAGLLYALTKLIP